MNEVTIVTDNKIKPFRYWNELPKKERGNWPLPDNEDYELDGYFCYRKHWYHIGDFMRLDKQSPFNGWDGYLADSFFSGVLVKLIDDDSYIVGTYYS